MIAHESTAKGETDEENYGNVNATMKSKVEKSEVNQQSHVIALLSIPMNDSCVTLDCGDCASFVLLAIIRTIRSFQNQMIHPTVNQIR